MDDGGPGTNLTTWAEKRHMRRQIVASEIYYTSRSSGNRIYSSFNLIMARLWIIDRVRRLRCLLRTIIPVSKIEVPVFSYDTLFSSLRSACFMYQASKIRDEGGDTHDICHQ